MAGAGMTAEPTLFPVGPVGRARANDPETSQDAARRIDPTKTRGRILDALSFYGAMTDDELCENLQIPARRWPSCKTARSALTHQQFPLVEWTGEIREGQRVWRLAVRRTETVVPSAAVL